MNRKKTSARRSAPQAAVAVPGAAHWPAKLIRFEDTTGTVEIFERQLVEPKRGWQSLLSEVERGSFDAYLNNGSPWTVKERWHTIAPTMLFLVSRWAPAPLVNALLRRGASPLVYSGLPLPKEKIEQEALFAPVCGAVRGGNAEALRLLLDAGGSAEDGIPLLGAIQGDHRDCFDLLLERGADVSARARWMNGSLLAIAEDLGRSEMAEEIRRRLEVKRQAVAPRLLRESKRRSSTPWGRFSGFARARWAAHLSWLLFAMKHPIDGIATTIGGGSVVEDAANKRVRGREVTFLVQTKGSKWTWYLWRPELHRPEAQPKDIEALRARGLELARKLGGTEVLIFRDANVDKISKGRVAELYVDRWPPFAYAEQGEKPTVSAKQALADLDKLCEKEGLELPHLIVENDGLEWTIDVVNYPIANIGRVDAIVADEV